MAKGLTLVVVTLLHIASIPAFVLQPPPTHATAPSMGLRQRRSCLAGVCGIGMQQPGRAIYNFDRFLRYDEMAEWLSVFGAENPDLVSVESYGKSFLGRDLLLITITDKSTGSHDTKPAHWIDANIHATEVTSGVAALYVAHDLVTKYRAGDRAVVDAVQTRTFYIAPRVNPDGVEDALGDVPRFHRSSVRPWPWRDGHRWPGLHVQDIDGDGCVRTMRIPDPDGGWIEHPEDPRVMVPLGLQDLPQGARRYRLLDEGVLDSYDGFTIPLPRDPAGLDLNRNFPAGWGPEVPGAGDHPQSEPEVDALVRAVRARPNVCGYNALHTPGGFLLRPSSTRADSTFAPDDLQAYKHLGRALSNLTGYPVHSVYEDFTPDKSELMSGAADDWAWDQMGVFAWTTELWDAVHAATGRRSGLDIWWAGPAAAEELAVCRWADAHAPGGYAPWRPFDHPQLGRVEVGGADRFRVWENAPAGPALRAEVAPQAAAAVRQALASPQLVIRLAAADRLGPGLWRVRVGVANAGWLGTEVSRQARARKAVVPVVVTLEGAIPISESPLSESPLSESPLPESPLSESQRSQSAISESAVSESPVDAPAGGRGAGGAARAQLGQLEGRGWLEWGGGRRCDGTPDRALHTWVVRGRAGDVVTVTATHPRAGRAEARLVLP